MSQSLSTDKKLPSIESIEKYLTLPNDILNATSLKRILAPTYKTTNCYNPKEHDLNFHCCKNPRTQSYLFLVNLHKYILLAKTSFTIPEMWERYFKNMTVRCFSKPFVPFTYQLLQVNSFINS